ncbi:MAG: hypothetical protein KJ069_23010 [Anaerolineae bacterium]|nr:hypothetical protein [Anaerolineae bacterium]
MITLQVNDKEMSEEKALAPVDQKQVEFYGDELTAMLVEDGTVYVPVRPICDYLGLSWTGERERINRDPVLADVVRFVRVTRTNSVGGNSGAASWFPRKWMKKSTGFVRGTRLGKWR